MARKDRKADAYTLGDQPAAKELIDIQQWLADGNLEQLEFAAQVVEGFPKGGDGFVGSPWIIHAVESGCLKSVKWMIEKGADINSTVGGGYPAVLSCIESDSAEKYHILEALIAAGADINQRGINGWTPLHMAAVRDDQQSMSMLLSAGADTTITTLIDDDTTPEEEARLLGHEKSAEFIANFVARSKL